MLVGSGGDLRVDLVDAGRQSGALQLGLGCFLRVGGAYSQHQGAQEGEGQGFHGVIVAQQ
jgi:hypothetical protein